MLPEPALRAVLPALTRTPVAGDWCRMVALEYLAGPPPGAAPGSGPDPLWPKAASRTGARFTPIGGPPTLYLAADGATAMLEVEALIKTTAAVIHAPKNPLVLVTVKLIVTDVLDLTDDTVQRSLLTSTSELTGVWRWVPKGGLPPTQLLGKAAFESGAIKGLRYRSSKNPEAHCLAVFPDRLVSGQDSIKVLDTSGRLCSRLP